KPTAVLLTNLLLSAVVPMILERLGIPVVVSLQGDDIFLDALSAGHRQTALEQIRQNCSAAAGFIATSRYYADFMAEYVGLPRDSIRVVYPGINHRLLSEPDALARVKKDTLASASGSENPKHLVTIGYFARIAPEKGLHRLVDAILKLPDVRLR